MLYFLRWVQGVQGMFIGDYRPRTKFQKEGDQCILAVLCSALCCPFLMIHYLYLRAESCCATDEETLERALKEQLEKAYSAWLNHPGKTVDYTPFLQALSTAITDYTSTGAFLENSTLEGWMDGWSKGAYSQVGTFCQRVILDDALFQQVGENSSLPADAFTGKSTQAKLLLFMQSAAHPMPSAVPACNNPPAGNGNMMSQPTHGSSLSLLSPLMCPDSREDHREARVVPPAPMAGVVPPAPMAWVVPPVPEARVGPLVLMPVQPPTTSL